VFDSTSGELKPLNVLGWYVGYEHRWKEWARAQNMNLRSTVLWSLVAVDNYDFQPPDAYKRTNRLALNLVYSPSSRVDVGAEYIYGKRENHDGQHGEGESDPGRRLVPVLATARTRVMFARAPPSMRTRHRTRDERRSISDETSPCNAVFRCIVFRCVYFQH
jgi:hypothetical protein